MRRKLCALAALTVAALTFTACSGNGGGDPESAVTSGSLEDLIAAAQDEGELTFYLTPPESTGQELADAFAEKYDIEANFVRLTGSELATRFSSEAAAGAPVADVVMPSYDSFIDKGIADGTLVALDKAGIPDFDSFPADAKIDGGKTAVVQYAPSALSWNTEKLGTLPTPESFADLADPEYAGKVLLTDPSSSQAYLQFWTLIIDKYGIDTVKAIADNQVRLYNSVVPMTESLVAGEGAVTGPNVGAVVTAAKGNGAPVDFTIPEVTTGPEIVLSIAAKSAHPNAARLFAHFVLSEDGAEIINGDPGVFSAYQTDELPSGYERVDRDTALSNQEEILGAFGK